MKFKAMIGAACLAAFCMAGQANAVEVAGKAKDFAKVYGQALPPVGFVEFCGRNPEDCLPSGGRQSRVDLTPERWALLAQVNSYVGPCPPMRATAKTICC